ncbi:unnamed protein product [Agarophyton chilense]
MSFFSATLSIALFALLCSPSQAAEGFIGPCRINADCANGRVCREVDFENISILSGLSLDSIKNAVKDDCGREPKYCVCLPESGDSDLTICSGNDKCLDVEVCRRDEEQGICISKTQNEAILAIQEKAEADESSSAVCGTLLSQCPSERQCVGSPVGFCLAKLPPPSDANAGANADGGQSTSENDAESGDQGDDSSEVCIAAKSLAHLDRNHLIYRNHVSARVLCDSFQSCATAGHMVRYRGNVMMMKSYCRLIGGCTRSIMHVNSPRYRRALQIPSDTPHLTFTAFAARYVTSAEEHVLRTAVRLGL